MALRVFVSYANGHNGAEHVRRLEEETRRSAPDLRIDWRWDEALQCGDNIKARIQQWIEEADAWVLLLNPLFSASSYCRMELDAVLQEFDRREDLRLRSGRVFPRMESDAVLQEVDRREDLRLRSGRVFPVCLDDTELTGGLWRLRGPWGGLVQLARDQPVLASMDGDEIDRRWANAAKGLTLALLGLAKERGEVPKDCLEDLREEIRVGALTPFLGPACCDLQENRELALPHLRSRLRALLAALTDERDKGASQFSLAIAASRRLTPDGDAETDDNGDELPPAFMDMQIAIARLGAAACEVFGDALLRDHAGLTDTHSYSVLLGERGGYTSRLVTALDAAAAAASRVPKESTCPAMEDSEVICVGAAGIARKLDLLRSRLLGAHPNGAKPEERYSNVVVPVAKDRDEDDQRDPGSISFHHLEWLGDLLWHTLRFDAPMFPSPDDLSFQISLCACSPQCVAKIPMGMAAAVCQIEVKKRGPIQESCQTHLIQRFKKIIERKRPFVSDESLSGSLAAMLAKASGNHRESPTPRPLRSTAEATVQEEEEHLDSSPWPLLLSTNLDDDVESWFDSHGIAYLQMFPVQVIDDDVASPEWILAAVDSRGKRTFHHIPPGTGEDKMFGSVLPGGASLRGKECRHERPPLIVRLRGAPLAKKPPFEELDQSLLRGQLAGEPPQKRKGKRSLGSMGTKIRHRVLLSCLDFTRELEGERSLPRCIRQLMGDSRRALCFIGHVHDELDSLFGLRPEVWVSSENDHPELGNSRESSLRVGIGCGSPNDVRGAMIGRMGIIHLNVNIDRAGLELLEILKGSDI